jgi:hypothetical protein
MCSSQRLALNGKIKYVTDDGKEYTPKRGKQVAYFAHGTRFLATCGL